MRQQVLVVGGGIAGMVAALAEARNGNRVQLLEREVVLGGLLSSVRDGSSGCWFDYGTHVPAQTGAGDLDAELFGSLEPPEWRRFSHLKAGTFWNGVLSTQSPCLDLRSLKDPVFEEVLRGMTETRAGTSSEESPVLRVELDREYGPSARRYLFDPILTKFFGVSSEHLASGSHRLFGLIRFIGPEETLTSELKKNPVFDGRLAFHRASATGHTNYYPTEGGCGRWIDVLIEKIKTRGVAIRTGVTVKKIDPPARTAEMSDGSTFHYDKLVWALPAAFLLRLAFPHEAGDTAPPPLSTINLFHFVCSSRSVVAPQYVTCYDPAFRTFRVTIYGNLQEEAPGQHRMTVEVLRPDPRVPPPVPSAIFDELIAMGLVSPRCVFSSCLEQQISNGFPIQTPSFQRQAATAANLVAERIPGAELAGRGAGQAFFLKDVLMETWQRARAGRSD